MEAEQPDTFTIVGEVVAGFGVASGERGRVRSQDGTSLAPAGTIAMQAKLFEKLGLDLEGFYLGTLNLRLPAPWHPLKPFRHFAGVNWWPGGYPPEDFSFFRCSLEQRATRVDGYVYYPNPGTKISEFQPQNVMEIISPKLPEVKTGDSISLTLYKCEVEMVR